MTTPAPPQIEFPPIKSHYIPGTGSEQHIYRFPNGYVASVVRGPYTYGGPSGLYEVGIGQVTGPGDDDWRLTYDTPITDDVLGYQDTDDVAGVIAAVAKLPQQVTA